MTAMPSAPSPAIDLVELTVEQAQAAFANGTITSEALAQAFLDRIALYNATYNAIIFLNPDALETARAIDRRRAAGEALGPLAGIPVVIKDPMDMVGFPTTAGWSLLHSKSGGVDLMPATDSPVVARMRAADTVILGKTNVPVLSASGSHANDSWAGPTLNAAAPRVPAGRQQRRYGDRRLPPASPFSASPRRPAVRSRIPASAQGLVGIKPTFALVPNAGVMPLSANRDVVGPIARCVRDAALTLDVLAGYTAEDPKTIAGVGHRPKGGYTVEARHPGPAPANASASTVSRLARPAALGRRRPPSMTARPRRNSRRSVRSWSRIPSPARALPSCAGSTVPGVRVRCAGARIGAL